MLNPGIIVFITLLGIYVVGTLIYLIITIVKHPDANICVSLFDSLLWPGDLITCLFCISPRPRSEGYLEDDTINNL